MATTEIIMADDKKLEPQDRWAIAAYIRALQLSQNAKPTDLPADVRDKLEIAPK